MSCLRDHGNVKPEAGRLSSYIAEERGDSALCIHGLWEYTSNAFIGVARPDHTDLFSCEWMTSSQPCISPFLPIYIGVNKIPKALGTTEAYELFEKLRADVEYHPEYREEITRYWSVFEIQTIEESYLVEKEATPLADNGKIEEARELLTSFVQKKCDEAMTNCQKMLEYLGKLPLIGKRT
jgi:dipeptidase